MKLRVLRILLLVMIIALAVGTPGPASAVDWSVGYASPVQVIPALAVFDGKLYAGGMSNTQSNAHLFVFDGNDWSDIDFASKVGVAVNMIESLEVFNGQLFIGARTFNGTTYNSRVYSSYDGTTFTQDFSGFGNYFQSGIGDLAIHDGELYATVSVSNGEVFKRIGANNWVSVGGAFTSSQMPRALASYQGSLYVGTNLSGAVVSRWNGSTWELAGNLTTLLGIPQTSVWSLAADGNTLYAGPVGTMALVSSTIPAFDGTDWVASQSVIGNTRVREVNGQVWAGALDGKIYRNVDGTWQAMGQIPNYAFDFAEYKGNIYAAGSDGKVYRRESPDGYIIRGKITDLLNNAISDVQLSDGAGHTTVTDTAGNYIFEHLSGGTYTITPTLSGYSFFPEAFTYTLDANKENQNYSGTITINVDISLYSNPATSEERTPYENIINYFANGVYESSNGARKIGTVVFHKANTFSGKADINWVNSCDPSSYISGFGMDGLSINMCDNFDWYHYLSDDTHQRGGGYTLAHEWGHYYFSLYDEYLGEKDWDVKYNLPHTTDKPVTYSIMNSQWNAVNGDNNWLNFSVDKYFNTETAQYRMYGASGWDTLSRPLSADPKDGKRSTSTTRLYYPDLAGYWPGAISDARIDLPGTARSALQIIWDPGSGALATQLEGASYTAQLSSITGEGITYPDPILLLAFVQKVLPLANSGVQASVLLPNGTTDAITFTDDGLAPDVLQGDGLYSAILGYEVDGIYTIQITFDNNANTAAFISTAFQPSLGPDGQPVSFSEPVLAGENYSVSKTIQVTVSDVKVDDHPDSIEQAEMITVDNLSIPGKIDFSGDQDIFKFTTLESGITHVRVTDLALGMNPHIRILDSDGVTVLFEAGYDPVYSEYPYIPLTGIAPGTLLYVEVTHASVSSSGGLYEIGIGPKLVSDTHQYFSYMPYVKR
jgi:hypothetical protein